MTIQELASEASKYFVVKKRTDDTSFHTYEEGTPEWIAEMVRKVHGNMFFNNYTFRFIEDALEAISYCENDRDIEEISIEPDIYNRDLADWLASDLWRGELCNQALAEWELKDIYAIIGAAQCIEKQEVLNLVISSLTDRLTELELEQE